MKLSRLVLASTLLAAGSLVFSVVGCSRQSEGERCSLKNGNNDCDGDLVCTSSSALRGGDDGVDRCCPKAGEGTSDERCTPFLGGGSGGGTGVGGQGGQAGDSGSGGDTATGNAGDACDYNSDCTSPLVCGPQGVCQVECKVDRDCPDGKSCVGDNGNQRCE